MENFRFAVALISIINIEWPLHMRALTAKAFGIVRISIIPCRIKCIIYCIGGCNLWRCHLCVSRNNHYDDQGSNYIISSWKWPGSVIMYRYQWSMTEIEWRKNHCKQGFIRSAFRQNDHEALSQMSLLLLMFRICSMHWVSRLHTAPR